MSTVARLCDRDRGARLRSERERLGLSSQRVASLLDVSTDTLARYENGAEPNVRALSQLHTSGFDIVYIVSGEKGMAAATTPRGEESELLKRFRELSLRGRSSMFLTLDALERLAPNLRRAA
ncbi:MAG: helix-turn-helix transcriptional regulator [Burkholderiaceae bacterium]